MSQGSTLELETPQGLTLTLGCKPTDQAGFVALVVSSLVFNTTVYVQADKAERFSDWVAACAIASKAKK